MGIGVIPWAASAAQSVTLAWDPSPDASVVGYTVRYGTNSARYSSFLVVGPGTMATVPNLIEGVSYFFSVTAYTFLGLESEPSQELQYTVPVGNNPERPTLDFLNTLAISEDAGQQTVTLSGITAGLGGILNLLGIQVTASSSNPALIPDPIVNYVSPGASGSIRFTPVPEASGSANITVTVNNFKLLNNLFSRVFTVNVNAANDPPTLNHFASITLPSNPGAQTVQMSGISSGAANENQLLTVTATSSNPALIPHPVVNYSPGATVGSLVLLPQVGVSGTATIAVMVNDGQSQNGTVSRLFNVMVGGGSPSTIYLEAESGAVSAPMVSVQNANASSGRYVHSGSDYQGTVSFQLNIPEAGDYVVWCRVLSADGGSDSFFVSMDGANEQAYGTAQNNWSPDWQWSQVNGLSGLRTFSLSQGTHILTFRARERYTPLDAIYVTNDRNFSPNAGPQLALRRLTSGTEVSFRSWTGVRYDVQTSEDFVTWTTMWLTPLTSTIQTLTFVDSTFSPTGARFYRVRVR